jgi:signal transduction histidine kinase
VAAPVLAALLVDVAVNATLVMIGAHLLTNVPAIEILNRMTGSEDRQFFLTSYLTFGLLAILLATVHIFAGWWSPIAFGIPLVLARRMFARWKQVADVSVELSDKQQALLATLERIVDERREERLALAADIHDEVLQPLYQVHLMGQVLRQDLASGRLLQLEEDLPGLLEAADAANNAIRDLLREARRSHLGSRGLTRTLALLVDDLRQETDASITLDVEDVGGSPLTQLVVYQIAREALRNAVRHSRARNIRLSIGAQEGFVRLVVQDDGIGLPLKKKPGHFGLQLMRERAEIVGGTLFLDSSSRGVVVAAKIPLEAPRRAQSPRQADD